MFWREINLWVLSLYTALIGRVGVTDKLKGTKGVCWVSGFMSVNLFMRKQILCIGLVIPEYWEELE